MSEPKHEFNSIVNMTKRQRNLSINAFDYLEKTTYITNFNMNFKLTWKKSFYMPILCFKIG